MSVSYEDYQVLKNRDIFTWDLSVLHTLREWHCPQAFGNYTHGSVSIVGNRLVGSGNPWCEGWGSISLKFSECIITIKSKFVQFPIHWSLWNFAHAMACAKFHHDSTNVNAEEMFTRFEWCAHEFVVIHPPWSLIPDHNIWDPNWIHGSDTVPGNFHAAD